MLQASAAALLFLAASLTACSTGPIRWDEVDTLVSNLAARAGDLRFDGQGRLVVHTTPAVATPAFAGQCAGSLRLASSEGGVRYAAWWSPRPDSSAELRAAASVNGGPWSAPRRVDTTDASRSGCRRPAPAIATDGDNVHIVYAMGAREGPGIFLSHSTDRGGLFHLPVAVVYGENPGLASVAARGNLVIVAFEDPNTRPTRISVAVSRTMAHLFEFRQVVSPPGGAVVAPEIATDGVHVAASWRRAGDSSSTRFVRLGRVR